MRNYIVYQIWGNNPLYLIGIIENIKLCPIIYPKWKVKVYYNDVPEMWLNKIKNIKYVECIKVKVNNKIKFQNWRILPLFDKKVDVFICRDADSRLSYREKAAVDEWLESNQALHIMRDHPKGHKTIMLAGMCGFNNTVIRNTIKFKDQELLDKLNLCESDSDQELLRKYIFPFFKTNHLSHDKYRHFNYGCEKDFPPYNFRIDNCNFVGEVVNYYNHPINWETKKILNKEMDKILKNVSENPTSIKKEDNNKYSNIYGMKVLSEVECIKLEKKVPNDHNPLDSYDNDLQTKIFNEEINKVKRLSCKNRDTHTQVYKEIRDKIDKLVNENKELNTALNKTNKSLENAHKLIKEADKLAKISLEKTKESLSQSIDKNKESLTQSIAKINGNMNASNESLTQSITKTNESIDKNKESLKSIAKSNESIKESLAKTNESLAKTNESLNKSNETLVKSNKIIEITQKNLSDTNKTINLHKNEMSDQIKVVKNENLNANNLLKTTYEKILSGIKNEVQDETKKLNSDIHTMFDFIKQNNSDISVLKMNNEMEKKYKEDCINLIEQDLDKELLAIDQSQKNSKNKKFKKICLVTLSTLAFMYI